MSTATGKLTRKYQATIPAPVRAALKLQAGGAIAFDIGEGEIRLRKARATDRHWTKAVQATLTEWSGKADGRAYRDR